MIFDTYTYFEPIVEAHDTLTGLYPCSGYVNMEAALAHIRTLKYPILMVEDGPDCNLSISDQPGTDQHFTIYVICDGSDSRSAALNQSAELGEELLRSLKTHIRGLEGFNYKMSEGNIPMQRIGPLAKNGYGYSFTFSL